MPKTVAEAKKIIIKNLREMRYDKTECLFILDGDGKMILHPLKPELEGVNMLDVSDPTGLRVFREMVVNAQRDGDAFVQYSWQSKYSPIIFEPQMTYAKYDWSWDWVICSSLYTQDIVDAMSAIRNAGIRKRSTGTSGAGCCADRRTRMMPVTAPSASMPIACNG